MVLSAVDCSHHSSPGWQRGTRGTCPASSLAIYNPAPYCDGGVSPVNVVPPCPPVAHHCGGGVSPHPPTRTPSQWCFTSNDLPSTLTHNKRIHCHSQPATASPSCHECMFRHAWNAVWTWSTSGWSLKYNYTIVYLGAYSHSYLCRKCNRADTTCEVFSCLTTTSCC